MQPDAKRKPGRIELIIAVIIIIWGINTPIMKIGLMAMPPLAYNAVRLLLAAALLGIALLLSGAYRSLERRDLRHIFAVSTLGFFLNQLFVMYGMPLTTAGNAALVFATLPVEVALINRLLKLEHISRSTALGILIGLTGVFLIVLGSGQQLSLSGPHLAGAALLLIGQFGYAYYTVQFSSLTDKYSIYQIITIVIAINAALFTLIALPDLTRLRWADIPAAAWYSILFSATFALSGANFAWIWTVGQIGSTKASLYQYLAPIFAILFAWQYLDETFGLIQTIGAAVTFLGIHLTRNHPGRQPASSPTATGRREDNT